MALCEIPPPVCVRRFPVICARDLSLGNGGGMRSVNEIEEEVESPGTVLSAAAKQIERTIFVALGKEMKESETVLAWALQKSKGIDVCILHVHQPAQKIPMMGTRISISMVDEHLVRAYHESERRGMHEILDNYIQACELAGARAEKVWKESDSIEKGIVELISELGIRWLVMGAAANKSFSRKMKEPKSKKAHHVCTEAPRFCHIWFTCKRNLICTRVSSESHGKQLLAPFNGSQGLYNHNNLNPDANSDLDTGGSPAGSHLPTHSEKNMIIELDKKLEQLVAEAKSSGKEAYEESVKHKKAEKDVIDAIHRAKAPETLLDHERQRSSEIEEELGRGSEDAEKKKRQLDEVLDDLKVAQKERCMLEFQIADSNRMIEELDQKIFSAVELLKKYRKELDDLQVERDIALREAEELRKKQTELASSSSPCQTFLEFSFFEIEEATYNFKQSMKIGEGGYGCIYRGILRHTQVAIKMPHPNSVHGQGPAEFQQEVNILSKLRHPNIVTLIGACPYAFALIYEYMPNGSLEDRLNCKNNTPPLSWKTRIRIASELCSALIFLHSCRPQGIVHSDLKPANILLDANFVSKLSDFGICRQLPKSQSSENNTTVFCVTDPKGTLIYLDPEFLATGELTSMSDVYSFGIILLRLLTGKPALRITKEVKYALDEGKLKDILDPTAGDWPFVQAKQLAHLALSCCDVNRSSRPDLVSEVYRVLEPMKLSCGISSLRIGSEEGYQIPPFFVCPVFQEIMQEPVVAADGFTYEAEAIKGWLESGHDASPMTNLKLRHGDLVPNHALRSAIQEWLHTP